MPTLISLTFAAALAAAPAPDSSSRFDLSGALTVAPGHSADGRFQIEASARVGSGAGVSPGSGRYSLKSTNGTASCNAGNDIFRNGFE